MENFNDTKCSALKNRPKMFIFDCCQKMQDNNSGRSNSSTSHIKNIENQTGNTNINISGDGSFFEIHSNDTDGTSIESSKNGGALVNGITEAFNNEFSKCNPNEDGNFIPFDSIIDQISTKTKTTPTKLLIKKNDKKQGQILSAQFNPTVCVFGDPCVIWSASF